MPLKDHHYQHRALSYRSCFRHNTGESLTVCCRLLAFCTKGSFDLNTHMYYFDVIISLVMFCVVVDYYTFVYSGFKIRDQSFDRMEILCKNTIFSAFKRMRIS